MIRLILASNSPRRKELLEKLQYPFECVKVEMVELIDLSLSLPLAIEKVAKEKATLISASYPEDVVIAADTIVVLNNVVYGKPVSIEDARSMLGALSGNTHQVITGVCIKRGEVEMTFHQESNVTFFSLSPQEIEDYLATKEPFDKAGAYGIQGYGALLVERIEGDFYSIMGLPIALLKRKLIEFVDLN